VSSHRFVCQGDRIGRIFATWAIVNFGSGLKITEAAHILGYFFHGTRHEIMLAQNGLG
jgi:hypothetical protein